MPTMPATIASRLEYGALTDVPYRELFVLWRSGNSWLVAAYIVQLGERREVLQEGLPAHWPGTTRELTGRDGPVEATRCFQYQETGGGHQRG